MFEEFQEQRTRNVVRQDCQSISRGDARTRMRGSNFSASMLSDFKSLITEARTQKICKTRILFDRENVRAFFKKKSG